MVTENEFEINDTSLVNDISTDSHANTTSAQGQEPDRLKDMFQEVKRALATRKNLRRMQTMAKNKNQAEQLNKVTRELHELEARFDFAAVPRSNSAFESVEAESVAHSSVSATQLPLQSAPAPDPAVSVALSNVQAKQTQARSDPAVSVVSDAHSSVSARHAPQSSPPTVYKDTRVMPPGPSPDPVVNLNLKFAQASDFVSPLSAPPASTQKDPTILAGGQDRAENRTENGMTQPAPVVNDASVAMHQGNVKAAVGHVTDSQTVYSGQVQSGPSSASSGCTNFMPPPCVPPQFGAPQFVPMQAPMSPGMIMTGPSPPGPMRPVMPLPVTMGGPPPGPAMFGPPPTPFLTPTASSVGHPDLGPSRVDLQLTEIRSELSNLISTITQHRDDHSDDVRNLESDFQKHFSELSSKLDNCVSSLDDKLLEQRAEQESIRVGDLQEQAEQVDAVAREIREHVSNEFSSRDQELKRLADTVAARESEVLTEFAEIKQQLSQLSTSDTGQVVAEVTAKMESAWKSREEKIEAAWKSREEENKQVVEGMKNEMHGITTENRKLTGEVCQLKISCQQQELTLQDLQVQVDESSQRVGQCVSLIDQVVKSLTKVRVQLAEAAPTTTSGRGQKSSSGAPTMQAAAVGSGATDSRPNHQTSAAGGAPDGGDSAPDDDDDDGADDPHRNRNNPPPGPNGPNNPGSGNGGGGGGKGPGGNNDPPSNPGGDGGPPSNPTSGAPPTPPSNNNNHTPTASKPSMSVNEFLKWQPDKLTEGSNPIDASPQLNVFLQQLVSFGIIRSTTQQPLPKDVFLLATNADIFDNISIHPGYEEHVLSKYCSAIQNKKVQDTINTTKRVATTRNFLSVAKKVLTQHCKRGAVRKILNARMGSEKFTVRDIETYCSRVECMWDMHRQVHGDDKAEQRESFRVLDKQWDTDIKFDLLPLLFTDEVHMEDDSEAYLEKLAELGWSEVQSLLKKVVVRQNLSGKTQTAQPPRLRGAHNDVLAVMTEKYQNLLDFSFGPAAENKQPWAFKRKNSADAKALASQLKEATHVYPTKSDERLVVALYKDEETAKTNAQELKTKFPDLQHFKFLKKTPADPSTIAKNAKNRQGGSRR